MSRNLVVCFDGTWNKDEAEKEEYKETNVKRIYDSITESNDQLKSYIRGVGTGGFLDKFIGGCTGLGVSENIRTGYTWLCTNYKEKDRIFVFGFSRGAYTARSLVGIIRNCGLLFPSHVHRVNDAYDLYRKRDESADTNEALEFRSNYSRDPKAIGIHFVGVWDTVGSLGIPGNIDDKTLFQFHDTQLSSIVKNAFHAVAIDEHRRHFDVTLWSSEKGNPNQIMEQRWFAGVHSDIGGGYRERELADITLKWMQEKAYACGLSLDPEQMIKDVSDNYLFKCHDSCFGKGCSLFKKLYYFLPWNNIHRKIGQAKFGNETIDESVSQKCQDGKCNYSPENPGLGQILKR